jgi:hypothetical protein
MERWLGGKGVGAGWCIWCEEVDAIMGILEPRFQGFVNRLVRSSSMAMLDNLGIGMEKV